VQQPLQVPVARRLTRSFNRLVVLAEELGTLPLGQVTQNDLGVIRTLGLNGLS
jgi:hypothetical protein